MQKYLLIESQSPTSPSGSTRSRRASDGSMETMLEGISRSGPVEANANLLMNQEFGKTLASGQDLARSLERSDFALADSGSSSSSKRPRSRPHSLLGHRVVPEQTQQFVSFKSSFQTTPPLNGSNEVPFQPEAEELSQGEALNLLDPEQEHAHSHAHTHVHSHSHADPSSNQNPTRNVHMGPETAATLGSGTGQESLSHLLGPVINLFKRFIPICILLAFKVLYDHRIGIFISVGLYIVFCLVDKRLREVISRRQIGGLFGNGRRAAISLLWLLAALIINILLLYYVFRDEQIYRCLYLMPAVSAVGGPTDGDFWTMLWIIVVNDFVLMFVTVSIKIGIVLAYLLTGTGIRRRGRYLMLAEMSMQCYREFPPLVNWMCFLLVRGSDPYPIAAAPLSLETNAGLSTGASESGSGFDSEVTHPSPLLQLSAPLSGSWFTVVLAIVYFLMKIERIYTRSKTFYASIKKFIALGTPYGVSPKREELHAAGDMCAVCHDAFHSPTKLHCGHIFCGECIAVWFEREASCPMCRSRVSEQPIWNDGSTCARLRIW